MSHGRHLHPNSNPTRGVILLICPVSLQPFLATHLSPVPSRPLTLPLVRSSFQDCSVALVKPTSTLPLPPGKDPPLPCSRCNDSAPLSLLSSLGGTHCLTAFSCLSHKCMLIPPSASGKSIPRSFLLVSSRPDIACLHRPGR